MKNQHPVLTCNITSLICKACMWIKKIMYALIRVGYSLNKIIYSKINADSQEAYNIATLLETGKGWWIHEHRVFPCKIQRWAGKWDHGKTHPHQHYWKVVPRTSAAAGQQRSRVYLSQQSVDSAIKPDRTKTYTCLCVFISQWFWERE